MIKDLEEIFKDIDLSWCDGKPEEIINSEKYQDLLLIFPNLKKIFAEGQKMDKFEFDRTVKHVFRVFKVFLSLKEENFHPDTLNSASLSKISEKIHKMNDVNEQFLPLIFMYHDIGRFIDKNNHPLESYNLISEHKLFDSFKISDSEKLLLNKIIQYHLFFATIYTGESTYYGISTLLNDKEFINLISIQDGKYIDVFVDLLEIFTYIDIFGYSYAQIYDHYVKHYDKINKNLKELLKIWPNHEEILKKASYKSQEMLEWRIAGGLRIFQFVETKPYLTEEFYYNKIKESIHELNIETESKYDWKTIKNEFLINTCRIQVRYGLAFLMILAFGNFSRTHLGENQKISPKLINFWISLSKDVSKRSDDDTLLWNLYFTGLPFWAKINRKFVKQLDNDTLLAIIKDAKHEYDKEKKEMNLILNFKMLSV